VHPGKIVSTSQEVEVMVLEIDQAKRRVSLGLKQTMRNPWEVFAETHPEGTEVEGEVKNITEFGLFIGLPGEIDGMVHLSDLSWDERGEDAIQNYRKGDVVKAVVSEVDVEKERISLSIKALGGDKFAEAVGGVKRGSIITVEVTSIEDGGIEVEYEGMKSFIRRSDLSRDRSEQRPERFSVGDKVDVRHQHRQQDPPSWSLDQGPRDRRREGSGRTVWQLRLGRLAGRHPRRRAERRRRQVNRLRKEDGQAAPSGSDGAVFFCPPKSLPGRVQIGERRPRPAHVSTHRIAAPDNFRAESMVFQTGFLCAAACRFRTKCRFRARFRGIVRAKRRISSKRYRVRLFRFF
jgi:predicted RNA-binding protein with RPS1 domain